MNGPALAAQFSSATDDWATPQDFFDKLDREFDFLLDVCASDENAKVPGNFYSVEDNCLIQDWAENVAAIGLGTAFMNPKYGDPEFPCKPKCTKKKCRPCDPTEKSCQAKKCGHRGHHISEYVPGIIDFVRKASEESRKGLTVVCLLPSRDDTEWWHRYVLHPGKDCSSDRMCKHDGQVEIRKVRGRLKFGNATNSAPFPSAVVVFRPPVEAEECPGHEGLNGALCGVCDAYTRG